jgi:signal transduction histidine kinase
MVNPAVPEVIESVIVRLLEKDPDRRYSSADDALAALPDASEIEKLLAEEVKRRTSDRLSRTLLERIVRSSTTHRKLSPGEVDTEDALISVTPDGEPEPLSQDLLVYAALEDTIEAVEAERRQMARRLQETVIDQLNLLLSQSNAYLQTVNNPAANMAISVLMTLTRQVLQQARDLESHLHPTVLESLGLEPALETLANQEMRARGLHIVLSLQRMRERLPPQLELTLFRTAQDAIDRAVRQAQCSHIAIRLYRRENDIFFSVDDNGLPPSGEILRHTRQRVEGLGGAVDFQRSQYGGLALTVQFAMESPADLTERELEVIRLVAEGLSNKEIGALLYISPRTVKFHLDNIYSKLGVNTRTEAAIFALRRGWVRQRPDPMDRSEPPKGSFMS